SDGLASDARRLAEASGVRIVLDAAALPIAPGVREVAAAMGADPVELAATGGEDYELCACVPRGRREAAAGLTWIGEVAEGPPDVTWRGAALGAERWRGWEHGGG
ncbi:MAG: thiamine-phosphate kinase, partial [Actinomycetota bacterium]|nr:thiamine-phosphate kinase [Actinomycetota bacterium]